MFAIETSIVCEQCWRFAVISLKNRASLKRCETNSAYFLRQCCFKAVLLLLCCTLTPQIKHKTTHIEHVEFINAAVGPCRNRTLKIVINWVGKEKNASDIKVLFLFQIWIEVEIVELVGSLQKAVCNCSLCGFYCESAAHKKLRENEYLPLNRKHQECING